MGNCMSSSSSAARAGLPEAPRARGLGGQNKKGGNGGQLEREVRALSIKELKRELQVRKIPLRGLVEKEDLVQALLHARRRESKGSPSRRGTKPASSRPPASPSRGTAAQQQNPDKADPAKWKVKELRFDGSASYGSIGKQEKVDGNSIQKGIDKVRYNPDKYVALTYQANMVDWPVSNQKYTLIHREGTEGYLPQGASPRGQFAAVLVRYERCAPFPGDELPRKFRDKYTDTMSYEGRRLHSNRNKPVMPGRGMGVGDAPNLKIIGDVDPSDIAQGSVGDCWLLSAIAALAEFDGAVKRCFRKTPRLDQRPLANEPNMYTISLYDLKTWREVDVVIDERLCVQADGSGKLLGAAPSEDGELWVCLLEKALAAHCGGWDKIKGGQCTHAWALLTGCKHQYTISKNPQTGEYACHAKFNPMTNQWARHANSPHDCEQSVWQVDWPAVGGGGSKELTQEELFMRMCAWDDVNYIVGASVGGTSDKNRTDGMVNNHAYSVIEAHNDVAGTDVDLFKVRNPWGKGEIEDGLFDDDGPGWDRYPQVKRKLNPVVADDGIFYLTKKEFFHHFSTIYLSASNMTAFLED